MKLKIKVESSEITATLSDSETAQEFASLLPVTLTMEDLFSREKYATLPRAVEQDGERKYTYEVGDIAYWSPTSDVAIFYHHDGQEIPEPGIIVVGKVDSGIEAFNVPGAVTVTIELI